MPYLLDTNAWVAVLRQRDPQLTARIASNRQTDILLCSVVKAELLYGAYHSPAPQKNLQQLTPLFAAHSSLPFDDASADHYGQIRAVLDAQGKPIGANDYMIAAIALANNLTVVTHDVSEFSRVPGLRVEDWQTP